MAAQTSVVAWLSKNKVARFPGGVREVLPDLFHDFVAKLSERGWRFRALVTEAGEYDECSQGRILHFRKSHARTEGVR